MNISHERSIDCWFESGLSKPVNPMDHWILSFTKSLIFVKQEMKAYRLYTVVPKLVGFIENLTNWYVKMNRKRFKADEEKEDCLTALETLPVLCKTLLDQYTRTMS
uniref:Methionyl/Valyl/Leucyl/Isoleucyl-tRNA synthetase anticodon-binding domain-containing protein n=1 Tax=Tetranychus urticae TaxID=32264 RepID=T1KTI9_TETUR